MKDSTDPVLSCLFESLVEDCAGSFENGAHFVGIDDARIIQQLGFQTHQPSRHLVFDGGDLVNVQVATNKIRSCWDFFEKFGGRGSYSTNGFETDFLTGVKDDRWGQARCLMTTVRPAHQARGGRPTEFATTMACAIKVSSKSRMRESIHLPWSTCGRSLITCVPAASPHGHKSLPVASLISFSAEVLAIGDDRRPRANCATALSGLQYR
jgi:hypothetical protein